MAFYGYVRVSTNKQDVATQVKQIESQYPSVANIFQDIETGKKKDRTGLKQLMEVLKDGDTVITVSLSRISRDLKDLLEIVEEFDIRGINFISLKEDINTTTPTGRLVFHIFGSLCQFEREMISERTKDRLEYLKLQGVKVGRKSREQANPHKVNLVKNLREQGLSVPQIMQETGLSRRSVYNYLNTLSDNLEE